MKLHEVTCRPRLGVISANQGPDKGILYLETPVPGHDRLACLFTARHARLPITRNDLGMFFAEQIPCFGVVLTDT